MFQISFLIPKIRTYNQQQFLLNENIDKNNANAEKETDMKNI